MNALFKLIFVFIGFIAGFLLLYLLMAFCLARIVVNHEWQPGNDVTIFVLSNGVHADVVVPVKTNMIDWSEFVKYENTAANDTTLSWLSFGWGDKGFYLQTPTWSDLTFSVALRAITGTGMPAFHTTFHNQLYETDKCRRIRISHEEYRRLTNFILASFRRMPGGELIPIKTTANYNSNDSFYEALGTYHLFNTSNTWSNNALKYSGLKTGIWTPFESGVLLHFRK